MFDNYQIIFGLINIFSTFKRLLYRLTKPYYPYHAHMIDKALSAIVLELNNYVQWNYMVPDEKVILSPVTDIKGAFTEKNIDKIFISLINVEHETVVKNRKTGQFEQDVYATINPAVNLNLYLLCAASFNDYTESLKFLSALIGFFQEKNVFTPQNTPELDPAIDKLILDIEKTSYENMNYIWGLLGSKYLPSVVYKMRMISIEGGNWKAATPLISTVNQTN